MRSDESVEGCCVAEGGFLNGQPEIGDGDGEADYESQWRRWEWHIRGGGIVSNCACYYAGGEKWRHWKLEVAVSETLRCHCIIIFGSSEKRIWLYLKFETRKLFW